MSPEQRRALEIKIENRKFRIECARRFKNNNSSEMSIYLDIYTLIWDIFNFSKGNIANNNKIKGQISLCCQYMQGMDLCDASVVEGLYTQAGTLLRQELEIISAIVEFSNDRRIDNKTPNVTNIPNAGKIYGMLSKVAHCSNRNISALLVVHNDEKGAIAYSIPTFKNEVSKDMFEWHLLFSWTFLNELLRIFSDSGIDFEGTNFERRRRKMLSDLASRGLIERPAP